MSDGETDVGSGSGSGNSGEYEETVMYQCKYCPGTRFNARERDEHRLIHEAERERLRAVRGQAAPGPSSRGRRNERQPSPAPSSTATLFEVIRPNSPPKKRKREAPKKPLKPGPAARGPGRPKTKHSRKIVPRKKYDHGQNLRTRFGSG